MKDSVDVICFKMLDDLPAIKIVADKDIVHVSIVIASQWDYWTAQQPGFLREVLLAGDRSPMHPAAFASAAQPVRVVPKEMRQLTR